MSRGYLYKVKYVNTRELRPESKERYVVAMSTADAVKDIEKDPDKYVESTERFEVLMTAKVYKIILGGCSGTD